MEFWGIEVPAGKPTLCAKGDDVYLHLTQAALGESKSGNDRVVIRVKVGEIEVVLGTLSQGKCDQMSMDLIFDTDFRIFHNGSSSVYLSGYRTDAGGDDTFYDSEGEDESEEDDEVEPSQSIITALKANGDSAGGKKAALVAKSSKDDKVISQTVAVAAGKIAVAQAQKKLGKQGKVTVVPEADEDGEDDVEDEDGSDDDEDEDDSEDEMSTLAGPGPFVMDLEASESDGDDDSFDGDMEDDDSEEISDDDDEGDEEDDDSDEDEDELDFEMATPSPMLGKKRGASSTPKVPEKKIRMDTPAKPGLGANGEKKSKAAPATPVVKTPVKDQKSPKDKKAQPKTPTEKSPKGTPSTPTSGKKFGDYKCTACDKNFATESALSQHSSAKHKVK